MSGLARSGALLGFVMGLGLALVWLGLPRHRRAGLAGRVLPYLRDTPRPSRLLHDGRPAGGAIGVVAGPVIRDLGAVVERVMGGADSVRRRQLRAGLAADVDRFRAEQVLWGALGAVVGAAAGVLALVLRDAGVVTVVMLTAIGLGVGVTGADYLLSRRAARREARMLTEFPTVAELLALAVGAGEGAVGALDRVCRLSHGELAGELRRCLADARAGANLPTALQGLADRTGLASLRRFVDGVVIAVAARHAPRRRPSGPGPGRPRGGAPDTHGGRRPQGDRHDGSGRLPDPPGDGAVRRLPRVHLLPFHSLTRKDRPMSIIRTLPVRAHLLADRQLSRAARRAERGDVPGWVLITLMTAGLVTALWIVAKGQLVAMFQSALSSVKG